MELPADKYLLEDYRNDLRVVEAPQFIDSRTPVIPVKNIGTGFPKPNSRQTYRVKAYNGAGVGYQTIATATANTNIYFVGIVISALNASYVNVGDGTDANVDPSNGNNRSFGQWQAAGVYFLPFPVKVNFALGIYGGAINQVFVVHYIEEKLT